MRAIYFKDLTEKKNYHLTGDSFHHLVNVVRVEISEKILLLNGIGLKIITQVEEISKKEIRLSHLKTEIEKRNFEYDLALGIPKRDALELSLKEATEIGFSRIYLVRSEYSQQKLPEMDRVQKLVISALEQSNSAFLPEIVDCSWENIHWDEYSCKLLLSTCLSKRENGPVKDDSHGRKLLIVGPEGGFSGPEEDFFSTIKGIQFLHFPTPIMRTPTALAVGAGFMLQRLMDR